MTNIIYICMAVCIVLSVAVAVRERIRTRKIMNRLNEMIGKAMDGTFSEEFFDESLYSQVENKMAQYLCACEVSSKNLSAEKDKIKTLISDISHQTKTPIANILLYTELLAEKQPDDETEEYLNNMNEQTRKLSFLISSLVNISRLETGILIFNVRKNNISLMLKGIYEQYEPKAKARKLRLVLHNADEYAVYDPKWTSEAVGNIVDNAIKYTDKGKIEISVKSFEMFICIIICDSGIGIPESEQAQVFSRFYRSPEVKDAEGVGIGLFLAREIISKENGYIKLESQVGKGSVFYVYLPK